MRKKFLFLALVSVVALATISCRKEQTDLQVLNRDEMDFSAFVNPTGGSTKNGFVEGTSLEETSWGNLHKTSDTKTARMIYVSAYVNSSNEFIAPTNKRLYDNVSEAQNYFEGRVFKKKTTTNWTAEPPIYWPISANIDFLAVSVDTSTTVHNKLDLEWSQFNVANKATLAVDESYMYDDILYSGIQGATYAGGSPRGSIPMTFNHAQAWITMNVYMKNSGQAGLVAVKRVILQDCYNTGNLVLTQDPTINGTNVPKVRADWTFRYDVKNNIEVPDNKDSADQLYGKLTYTPSNPESTKYGLENPLDVKPTSGDFNKDQCLDLLLPPQDEPAIIIEYYFKGFPNLFRCRCTPKSAQQWNMGKHYIYDISFNVHEMTVVPTVTKWVNATPNTDYQIEFEAN